MNIDKDVLKGMAVVAGAAVLAGCSTGSEDYLPGTYSVDAKWGMLVDLDKCIGCAACVIACKIENGTQHGVYWCNLNYKEYGSLNKVQSKFSDTPQIRRLFKPTACHHCRNAQCIMVCPTGASRYADDGTVSVDMNVCYGCMQCVDACPYGARQFNAHAQEENPAYAIVDQYRNPAELLTALELRNGPKHPGHTAEKCTFCSTRRAKGEKPACVETCQTGARWFGLLADPASDFNAEKARLLAEGMQVVPDMPSDPSHKNFAVDTKPSFYIAAKYPNNFKF